MERGGRLCEEDDVVFQILLWLPVMSLLRFKSVCRSWYALIESSYFVAQHLEHHHHHHRNTCNNDNLMVLFHGLRPRPEIDFFSEDDKFVSLVNVDMSPYFKEEEEEEDILCHLELVAFCNGIFCLEYNNVNYTVRPPPIVLWNLATKQMRFLPNSPFPQSCPVQTSNLGGFGFDVKTKDYKVVRILQNSLLYPDPTLTRIEVYSLNADSWTIIDDVVLPVIDIRFNPKAPYPNGIYCWMGMNYQPIFNSIVTFHLSDEVIGSMPFPDAINHHNTTSLTHFHDSIACIDTHKDQIHCDMWVLYEYPNPESWTMVYKFGPFASPTHPLSFSNNEEHFVVQMDKQLFLCNFVTHEMRNLDIQVHARRQDLDVFFYKESLVSIKGGNTSPDGVICAISNWRTEIKLK